MSFAQGLAQALRPLPGVIRDNMEQAREDRLAKALSEFHDQVESRRRPTRGEQEEGFVGPPVSDMRPMSQADMLQGLSRIYADHGRSAQSSNLAIQGLAAREAARRREEDMAYRDRRDEIADSRWEDSIAHRDARLAIDDKRWDKNWSRQSELDDFNQSRLTEQDQRAAEQHALFMSQAEREQLGPHLQNAYRALASGNEDLANEIFATHGEAIGRNLGLGPGRRVVGVQRRGDRIVPLIENESTGTTGPWTSGASADPGDRVLSMSLPEFGAMVGIEQQGPAIEYGTSEANAIRNAVMGLHTRVNESGQMFLPSGTQQIAADNLRDAEMLVTQYGIPLLTAVNIAYYRTKGPLSKSEAMQMAEAQAADEGLSRKERRAFVEQRAEQLMDESRHFAGQFEQITGGSQRAPQGARGEPGRAQSRSMPGTASNAPVSGQAPSPALQGDAPPGLAQVDRGPVTGSGEAPVVEGPSVEERIAAMNENRHLAAGHRARSGARTFAGDVAQIVDGATFYAPSRAISGARSGLDFALNAPGDTANWLGGVYGAGRDFTRGVFNATPPPIPEGEAAEFFDAIRRPNAQPTMRQVSAAMNYHRENPGVLTPEELAAIDHFRRRFEGSAR